MILFCQLLLRHILIPGNTHKNLVLRPEHAVFIEAAFQKRPVKFFSIDKGFHNRMVDPLEFSLWVHGFSFLSILK